MASDELPPSARALVIAGCVLFAVPLVAHAYAGMASRYVGDDYCAGYIFRDYGVLGGQWWFYRFWGAVPTTVLLMALTDLGGARVAAVLPPVAIALWVAAAAWAVRCLARLAGQAWGWWPSLLIGEVIVYATIQDAPNAIQSLYLRVPMLAYTGPLIAATFYAGMLATLCRRRVASATGALASAVVAFVAGAFGPVYVAMQTVALAAGALVVSVAPVKDGGRPMRRLLLAGVAGSIAALAFVALAPGNAARQQHFSHPPGWPTVISWSLLYAVFMLARPLLPILRPAIIAIAPAMLGGEPSWLAKALEMSVSPATLLIAIGVPAAVVWTMIGHRTTRVAPAMTKWVLIGLPVLAFGLVVASMAPGAYGTSAPPPPRALIIPQFVIVCAAVTWGCALAETLRSGPSVPLRLAAAAVALLAIWQPVASARLTLRQAGELRVWAARWDETDRQLRLARAGGEKTAIVSAIGSIGGVGSIGPDADDWVNTCAAQYYGLERITGTLNR